MFPSFKYLGKKLFTRSSKSQDGNPTYHGESHITREKPHGLQATVPQALETPAQPLSDDLIPDSCDPLMEAGTIADEAATLNNSVRPLAGDLISSPYNATINALGMAPINPQNGHFMGAHNFNMYNTKMIDHNYYVQGRIVFDILEPASAPEAALTAGARYPAPRCHPGSRKTINRKLKEQLLDLNTHRKITWLFGPAGAGKSAVAQTFGELCTTYNRLGAAFFFSAIDESRKRSNPLRVVPTLAYQLAICDSRYKQVITQQLASDPSILHATLRVQFQRLIMESFSLLTTWDGQQKLDQKTYVVIIDGLDECEDEDAQCELVELINTAAQRGDLPLVWLVCSRPEPHLKYTFSQLEYSHTCNREELVIDDAEAREDVDRFLRESFKKIHNRYRLVISTERGATWPPEEVFDSISRSVSGYFVLASTVARVVGDRTVGNPDSQLISLLSILQGLDIIGTNNPLQVLDIFYSRILSRVPEHVLFTAIQILGICARGDSSDFFENFEVERFLLFWRLEKAVFYSALEKLHSVIRVPLPEDARRERLSFYHKSFPDYLVNRRRSGRFYLPDATVDTLLGTSFLHWHNHILTYTNPHLIRPDEYSRSESMVNQWCPEGGIEQALRGLEKRIEQYYNFKGEVRETDADFFNALCMFNFGLPAYHHDRVIHYFMKIMYSSDWFKTLAGSQTFRTDIFYKAVDTKLLHHLSILTNGQRIQPIDITCPDPFGGLEPNTVGYLIIGHGSKSGIACCFRGAVAHFIPDVIVLNALFPPTSAQISLYCQWEKEVERWKMWRSACLVHQAGW